MEDGLPVPVAGGEGSPGRSGELLGSAGGFHRRIRRLGFRKVRGGGEDWRCSSLSRFSISLFLLQLFHAQKLTSVSGCSTDLERLLTVGVGTSVALVLAAFFYFSVSRKGTHKLVHGFICLNIRRYPLSQIYIRASRSHFRSSYDPTWSCSILPTQRTVHPWF